MRVFFFSAKGDFFRNDRTHINGRPIGKRVDLVIPADFTTEDKFRDWVKSRPWYCPMYSDDQTGFEYEISRYSDFDDRHWRTGYMCAFYNDLLASLFFNLKWTFIGYVRSLSRGTEVVYEDEHGFLHSTSQHFSFNVFRGSSQKITLKTFDDSHLFDPLQFDGINDQYVINALKISTNLDWTKFVKNKQSIYTASNNYAEYTLENYKDPTLQILFKNTLF